MLEFVLLSELATVPARAAPVAAAALAGKLDDIVLVLLLLANACANAPVVHAHLQLQVPPASTVPVPCTSPD